MSLINFILGVMAIGFSLYAINRWVPMEPSVKKFLNIAVIILLILWVLYLTGVLSHLRAVRIPSI